MQLTEARGRLIAIGGAEDRDGKMVILKRFVELAGGKQAQIVVMTAATNNPEEVGKEMTAVFKRLDAKNVKVIDVSSRADAMEKKSIEAIEKATALFFTGGDQLHITSLIGGTEMQKIIHERYEAGMLVGGTSAGAAMMSNSMILTGYSKVNPRLRCVEIGPGMDLIVGAIIDTHFSQRGRHGRLLAAVAHYPQDLGVGIDENTAIIVNKNKFEVIGEGAVTVIDGGAMTYTNAPYTDEGKGLALANVKIHVLPEGHEFNLSERRLIIPKNSRTKVKRAGAKDDREPE